MLFLLLSLSLLLPPPPPTSVPWSWRDVLAIWSGSNVYLSGDPFHTFWRSGWRRVTDRRQHPAFVLTLYICYILIPHLSHCKIKHVITRCIMNHPRLDFCITCIIILSLSHLSPQLPRAGCSAMALVSKLGRSGAAHSNGPWHLGLWMSLF